MWILFVQMPTAQNEQRSNILRLRRRFLKDQEKNSLNYAHKEIQQQRQKKVWLKIIETNYVDPYLSFKQFIF